MPPTMLTFSNPFEEISYLKEQNQEFEALIESLQGLIRQQQHQMDGMLKRLYGRSSEKLDPNQLLMQDLILEADKNNAQKTEESLPVVSETRVATHTRRHHGRGRLPEHLKRVEHILDIDEKEKSCECGKGLVHIGDDITERLDYQPSSLYVNSYVRRKYACPASSGDCDGCGVKQHVTPEGPIERSEADAGLLAHVIEEKYEHHNPLYRQQLRFERQGLELSRQTMADWMAGCALALKPLYELMREEILKYDIVLNDDTPVDMREGPSAGIQTARLWATVGGENLKYTLYNFTVDRCREGPLEFFKGYRGYFVSDAYAGYNGLFKSPGEEKIAAIINSACWAHARRYFIDAQKTAPRAAGEILMFIAQLYKIEAEIKHQTPEVRLGVRWKKSTPILAKINTRLQEHMTTHLPQSPMRKAIGYTLTIWRELNVYLQDGRLPIDNNLAENAIRPIALGRKNWLFLGSENGGHTAAVLMSFTATCRKNKINTWAYLRDVLQRIQSHPASKLHELLPERWQQLQTVTAVKKIPTT